LLAVGKPNPAKLGNFLEIDVFCHVSCAENAMLDSKEYMRPIVTPYELMLALDTDLGWDPSKYELDLQKLTAELDARVERAKERGAEDQESIAPRFSLATGKLKQTQRIHRVIQVDDEENALAKRFEGTVAVNQSPAAEYLASRSFQGLDPIAPSEPSVVVQGRRGIARNYTLDTPVESQDTQDKTQSTQNSTIFY
jgi:diphthamide biosynthesis protein 2